jgi:ABC-type transporter Mla subunit MlaD
MPARPKRPTPTPRASKKKVAPKASAPLAPDPGADQAQRLAATCESLVQALAEVPKASDFQPLADHLYTFAEHAPALLKSMQQIPQLTGPLTDICDNLNTLQGGLNEALLRMPRPEEYEPLAVPLREFARVAPALVESLSALPRLSSLLAAASERLDRVSERIENQEPASPSTAPAAPSSTAAVSRLTDVLTDLDEVRRGLLTAMGTLPRDEDYAPVARQLRELASVSPSLLEWLKEVPKMSAPLGDSLAALREAAERVAAARASVAAALAELGER